MTLATFTPAAYRVACLRRLADLATLADAWNRLADDVPFRRWEWYATWWRHYGTTAGELFTLVVYDAQDAIVGIAPWYLAGTSGRRVIRCVGNGEVCSDYWTVLTVPGLEELVAERLACWLTGDVAGQWSRIELEGVAADDSAVQWLVRSLSLRGHPVHRRQRLNTWRATLPAMWEQFTGGMAGKHQQRLRSLQRRVFDAGRAVYHRAGNEQQLERGFNILVSLHQCRWQSLERAGCFASPRYTAFHRDMCGRLLQQGRLQLAWIELDGQPVAANYSFVSGDTVYQYQSGVDPACLRESPGWLMHMATLRSAVERGFRHFDFLRGDEPYKRVWRATPNSLDEIRIVARRRVSRWRHHLWSCALQGKLGWNAARTTFARWWGLLCNRRPMA